MALYTMALTTLLLRPVLGHTLSLMPSFSNYTVPVEHISLPGNLDGAKANSSVNASTSDFWYFDTQPGGGPLQLSGPRNLSAFGATDGATITNDENGVRGEWKGVDATFLGTPLDKPNVTYTITIDSDEIGVNGTLVSDLASLQESTAKHTPQHVADQRQRAPAHYPCALNEPGVSEELVPYLYWANAVPDADADVDITIDGERISFVNGVGYHDKNWADKSIIKSHKFW
ncbi:hypothetical protein BDP81DRAFT_503520, partial [Colletotrichum phormii]